MKRLINCRMIGLFVAGLCTSASAGGDPDPLELMKRSDSLHRLPVERIEAKMYLQKTGGKPRSRSLVWTTVQDDKKGDKSRIRFTAPANVAGTAMITVENLGGSEDEQWLYLPAFRKTRRVGAAELGDRFVGTDFFNEDLKRRHVEDYKYRLLRSEKFGGHDCWVIESIPSAPEVVKETPYGKGHVWLRKDNLFVVRMRLFDRRMKPLKEITMQELKNVQGDIWRADKVGVVDIRRKHRTTLLIGNRKTNIKVPDHVFSKHSLGKE